jgi:hypothetical protein
MTNLDKRNQREFTEFFPKKGDSGVGELSEVHSFSDMRSEYSEKLKEASLKFEKSHEFDINALSFHYKGGKEKINSSPKSFHTKKSEF